MTWLKKNSSDNEQISIAESQPEPEQNSESAMTEQYAPEPETLEQPEPATTETAQPRRQSGRRRSQRLQEEGTQTKPENRRFATLKNSWIGNNWKTFVILFAIFCIAFYARAYYGIGPATEDGILLSGGSDSYYHHYVATVGTDTGDFHFWDNMLNYPVGTRNPRPPLYDWSITLTGVAMSPFFDGDIYMSTMYMFIFSTAFWGALTIYPAYFLGKEAFGRKTGIFAAFMLAVIPGHVQRSVLTNADHDAMTLFFIVLSFYFFLKALKTLTQKEWIANWEKPRDVAQALKDFIKLNPQALLYGVLGGFSIAGVALIWQGFAYVIVLIAVYFFVQILLNRFRNVDSFGVFMIFFVTIGTGLLLAFPYYFLSIQIPSWFDTPTYLFLGLSVFAVILMATRKYPWFLVFTSIIAAALTATILLMLLAPSVLDTLINALLSGGGYFINNKQYQTIAEAQAPAFSNLALSFGIITFWLSFIGVAWAAIQLPKSWKPDFTFILLWAGTSIYMAVSAARFMFNAAPAFAITAGWILAILIEKFNPRKYLTELRRAAKPHMTYNFKMGLFISVAVLLIISVILTGISGIAYPVFVMGVLILCCVYMLNLIAETNPSKIYNLLTVLVPISGALFYFMAEFYTDWVITDATHLFILAILMFAYMALYIQVRKTSFMFTAGILFLAFCIVVPNVWAGLDAGIPYETKASYDKEIYGSMPVFMQPDDYDAINGTNWYLGGFGYSLPLNSRYWPAAYDWLATQDSDIYPAEDRPAFLSWWDYGFEVVNEGAHPAVADNFLGGHQLAGNFIMAQSEEDAVALLCVRILEGDWHKQIQSGQTNAFDAEISALVEKYGIDSSSLDNIFNNPSSYVSNILANPDIYGPRDEVIQDANAKYLAARAMITQTLDMDGIVSLYNDLCSATGNSIRYFAIDSRLFPFSADNTGIFYAPAKLSDHRISDVANQPYDFWEIKAVGEYGGEYALDEIPPDVNLDPNNPYKIVYKEMFYNSMLYKAYIGYSGYDLGQGDTGIPGLSGDLASSQIMPGWNMSHFKLVHRTSYWNPYSYDEIQNHTDAWTAMNYWDAIEKQQAGEGISDLSDRSSIYQGVMMLKYYHGAIISGKVMLEDGTPLAGVSVTVTDDFDIPHQRVVTDEDGSYSIVAPPGDITLVASMGEIDPLTLTGTGINGTPMVIEDYQAMRANEDRDLNGMPDYLISQDLVVTGAKLSGSVYWDIDGDGSQGDSDESVENAHIILTNNALTFTGDITSDDSGRYSIDSLPPGDFSAQIMYSDISIGTQVFSVSNGETLVKDFGITVTKLDGTVKYDDNFTANSAKVTLWDIDSDIRFTAYSDENGYFIFDNILPGQFFIQAESLNYASTPQIIDIAQYQNNSLDILVYDSFSLTGSVTMNGLPVPYATIKFTGPSSRVVTTDSSGQYSAVLNDGQYIYYISHLQGNYVYASFGQIESEGDYALDIQLIPGSLVTGRITNEMGNAVAETPVVFDNLETGFFISSNTDDNGDYSLIVPQGSYNAQVSSVNYGCYYARHDLNQRTVTLNIQTRQGDLVSGSIFWDIDGSGDISLAEEQLSGARAIFKELSGNFAQAITDSSGSFTIVLPTTVQFDVTLSKPGFNSVNLGIQTVSSLQNGISQSLEPILIPIKGTVYLDDEPLTEQNIRLDFMSDLVGLPSAEFQVGRDGTYSGLITPGYYYVTFTHNITLGDDSEVYQIDWSILFDTGLFDGRTIVLDIEATKRSKISIHISNPEITGANITFQQGPESRSFNMDSSFDTFYIKSGQYIMSAAHALNESIMVDMQNITVAEGTNNNITIDFKEGIPNSGYLMYGGNYIQNQRITFRNIEKNGTVSSYTDESGRFEIYLEPNGRYNIEVNYVEYDYEPYLSAFRYFSLDQEIDASIPSNNYIIDLDREIYSIPIVGSVYIEDMPAPGTDIRFESAFGSYNVTTGTDGNFTLDIVPAEYTVYAHQFSSHYVLLDRTTVEIDQTWMDILLEKGNRLYGTAYYERNLNAATDIIFVSPIKGLSHTVSSSEAGYYEVWLPEDSYSIKSEFTALKNGLSVTYSAEITTELTIDTQLNLPLSLKENRIVFSSYDPNQLKLVKPNSTVIYYFQIENMGNIADTYEVVALGANDQWSTKLSSSEITVEPGEDNKATMSVSVSIPASAKTNENTLTITPISKKDSSVRHSITLPIPIAQSHSFAIQPSATSPVFDAGNLNSEFSVLNKGNGPDKFTIYIGNLEDLQKNGWKAELGTIGASNPIMDGKMLVNITVSPGESANIPIYLEPIDSTTSRQANVLIIGYSQMDDSIISSNNIILRYPDIQVSSSNISATGLDVSEAESGDQILNVGIMAISVASALLLFYYARKKRWIK